MAIPDAVDVFGDYSAEVDDLSRVTALVGRIDGNRLTSGIQIQTLPQAPPELLRSDRAVEMIDGTEVGVGELRIDESVLPDGYEVLVEPALEPPRALSAATAVNLANSDGPGARVQVHNPLPPLAAGGELERVEIDGTPAWSSPRPGGHTIVWPVSDTTWVSVGVRNGAGETLTLAESVELAAGVDFVGEGSWRAQYRVPEPNSVADGATTVGIDRGTRDRVSAGMLVYAGDRVIGQIAAAGESTSNVLLAAAPEFTIDATLAPETGGPLPQGCRVHGGNDHVGFVGDAPFDERVRVGAFVTTLTGAGIGSITSITEIGGEQVALLDVLDVARSPATRSPC